MNKFSKNNVYSTQKILGVKSVNVKKLHGYGHLEEVVVKRADQQLYKFKEGNFVDLHLNDIEDILILAIQHKIFHLNDSDIVDFIMALRMFTRSLVSKRRVEDLQLGVESYQKKLNIITPQQTFPETESKNSILHHTNHQGADTGKNPTSVSDEVFVSIEGVEDLKINVKIKGEKKEALLILRQKPGYHSLPVLKEFCPEIQVELPSGVVLVKRCGYLFRNWSSRSYVNSGSLLYSIELCDGIGFVELLNLSLKISLIQNLHYVVLHITTIVAMVSAIAIAIYMADIPYEEDYQFLAVILALLVPLVILAIGVDLL
ncbi:hypothetical protein Tco_0552785 [Tanacetum coccineum]